MITVAVIAVFTAPLLNTTNRVLILTDNYRLSLPAAKQAARVGGGLSGRPGQHEVTRNVSDG